MFDAAANDLSAALMQEMVRTDTVSALIDEFNDKHFVVNENGKAVIYSPGYDPILERSKYDRHSKEDFRTFYMNRLVPVSTDEAGNVTYKSAAEIWLKHPRRRQYLGGIRFDPSNQHDPSILNVWQGFRRPPVQGDWSLMRDHIHHSLCRGNEEHFRYLMGWMARMFQFPAKRAETAVVLKGNEGTGKGALANTLIRIIGHHAMQINNASHLVGHFNSHLRDLVFLFADEAFFAGDKAHTGVLKSLITEPFITIEAKYSNAAPSPNFLHVLMASNNSWVVPASLESRRFFVLDVSDEHEQDGAYFSPIFEQLENGGYEAMLYDLLAYDLTGFDVRKIPLTDGLIEQRKQSLPTDYAWWLDCLHREYITRTAGEWPVWMPKDSAYSSYKEFADERKERHILSRENLSKLLIKMGCKSERLTIDNPAALMPTEPKSLRVRGYLLPSLDDARAKFLEVTKLKVDWPREDDA